MTIFMFVICTMYALCKRRGKNIFKWFQLQSVYIKYVNYMLIFSYDQCFPSFLCDYVSTKFDLKTLIHARKVLYCIHISFLYCDLHFRSPTSPCIPEWFITYLPWSVILIPAFVLSILQRCTPLWAKVWWSKPEIYWKLIYIQEEHS